MTRLIAKNWAEFQHYKDRAPPWIKLHKTLLDNMEFATLSDGAARILVLLWLVASENNDGAIEADPARIAFRLRMPTDKVADAMGEIIDAGFFADPEHADDHGSGESPSEAARRRNGFGSRHIPDSVKREVWERDEGTCQACGATKNIEYDHKTPVSAGGQSVAQNLQLLCRTCNRRKRTKPHTDATGTYPQAAQAEHPATANLRLRSTEAEERRDRGEGERRARPVDNQAPAAPAPAPAAEPTPAVQAVIAMRQAGLMDVTASDPRLLKLIEQGVTTAALRELAAEAVSKRKGWAWAVAAYNGRQREAEDIKAAPAAPWHESTAGIRGKGIELGVGDWDEHAFSVGKGPAWPVYRAKVFRAAGFEPPRAAA